MSGVVPIPELEEDSLPEIYFDPPDKYWTRDRKGKWFKRGSGDIKLLLKDKGVIDAKGREYLSPLEKILLNTQEENNIQYAGPLAGYAEGLHTFQGKRILVTSGPQLVEPKKGEWPLLEGIFDMMLGHDAIQLQHFYAWLSLSMIHLYDRINNSNESPVFFPGQALALVGEQGAAKSLTQSVITVLLGGRCARPFQAMTGNTNHNGDLFEAEHLCIEDESPSTDLRTRRKLGAGIKMATANGSQRCRAMYKEAIELNPFWRMTLSVNSDPEHLLVLPPLDVSLADKIMFLKCQKHPMPMAAGTPAEKKVFWEALLAEVPAFAHSLLKEFLVPNAIKEDRFGVRYYHHPEILHELSMLSPEQRLLELVDMEIFKSDAAGSVTLRSLDLEKLLAGPDSACEREARRLFTHTNNTTIGNYLSKLSSSRPDRVEKGPLKNGYQHWMLNPP